MEHDSGRVWFLSLLAIFLIASSLIASSAACADEDKSKQALNGSSASDALTQPGELFSCPVMGIYNDDWELSNNKAKTHSRVHITHTLENFSAEIIDKGSADIPVGTLCLRGKPGEVMFPFGSFQSQAFGIDANQSKHNWEPALVVVEDPDTIKVKTRSGSMVFKRSKPWGIPKAWIDEQKAPFFR